MIGVEFYRRKARLSRPELAEKAGIPLASVISLENNDRRSSRFDLYVAVSDALGIPVDELLGEYDEATLLPGDRRTYKSKKTVSPPSIVSQSIGALKTSHWSRSAVFLA